MFGVPAAYAQTTTVPRTDAPAVTSPAPAGGQWYSRQATDSRASKLIGTTVKNDAGETVGDINELLITRDGRIAAVVIGVGGFLGIGEREVAVNYSALRISHDANANMTVSMNTTKDSLKAAPAWNWADDAKRAK
jgi:sporulation protein YlmC with PRC-barrel domain